VQPSATIAFVALRSSRRERLQEEKEASGSARQRGVPALLDRTTTDASRSRGW
jgi:hypothetical protein